MQLPQTPVFAACRALGRASGRCCVAAPTRETLATALATALQPDAAERAGSVASRIRTDGAEVAARRLIAAAA